MLSFGDRSSLGRRDFLRVGGLGLGSLGLSQFARAGAALSDSGRPVTDKSVIFVFLHGGPSQLETFDPKPDAPVETRTVTGTIPTKLPGVNFGASFPELAKRADRLAIVRSYVPGDASHDIKPVVSKATSGGSLGAAYSNIAGGNHPTSGMPTNVLLFPRSVDPDSEPGLTKFGNFASTGPFGSATSPFDPAGGGSLQEDMRLHLPVDRLDDRRTLLAALDAAKLHIEDGTDAYRTKALSLLLNGAGDAFDLKKEDPAIVSRYDTASRVNLAKFDPKWTNYKHYIGNAKTLGKLLLLARRLVERGAGFVTVTTGFVWDMHSDKNNAGVAEGLSYAGPPLDHALSMLLDDLQERGLSEKVTVVVCGEIGRSPKINKNGGRDHWGNLGTLLLSGGGLKCGQVIGKSVANGGEPDGYTARIPNLVSSLMHNLFDVGRLRVQRGVSRDVLQLIEPEPIRGLHGS